MDGSPNLILSKEEYGKNEIEYLELCTKAMYVESFLKLLTGIKNIDSAGILTVGVQVQLSTEDINFVADAAHCMLRSWCGPIENIWE